MEWLFLADTFSLSFLILFVLRKNTIPGNRSDMKVHFLELGAKRGLFLTSLFIWTKNHIQQVKQLTTLAENNSSHHASTLPVTTLSILLHPLPMDRKQVWGAHCYISKADLHLSRIKQGHLTTYLNSWMYSSSAAWHREDLNWKDAMICEVHFELRFLCLQNGVTNHR